jgi:uncharacterized protein YecE (DUF72 family)
MRLSSGKIYIGTSGWMYKDWARSFYPTDCPAKQHLGYYVTQFPTVEINATFYRLPAETAIQAWRQSAPAGFLYAVKGSRAVTHLKRLKPGAKSFDLLLDRLRHLRPALGPLLWQLPPNFPKNTERLANFLKQLPRRFAHAIEFRNPTWINEEVQDLLKRHRVANVSISSQAMPAQREITADFVYIRFHGLKGGSAHDYTDRELEPWAEYLRRCGSKSVEGFVYFNNDINSRAPLNAKRLMEMVGKYAVKASGQWKG